MERCFVMQPFDGAEFDSRYDDVLAPAIRAADLEPYRVDRDPSVRIPIDDIEKGIRDARICVADITLDRPNVWFELGFAIAARKEVVLVCADSRPKHFPFDVQHRSVITYKTGSISYLDELKTTVTQTLKSRLAKSEVIDSLAQDTPQVDLMGLSSHELIALATIAQSMGADEAPISYWSVSKDMEAAGFTKIAISIALRTLQAKEFIGRQACEPYNDEPYVGYVPTPKGWQWLIDNTDKFTLRRQPSPRKASNFDELDEDIPF